MVFLFSVFWETSIFFSTVAVPIYIPTNSVCKSFLFSTSSPTFVIYVLFDDSCSEGVKWYLIVILICVSLMISSVDHLFMCLLAIYISSLAQCLFRYSTYFLIILLGFGFCFDVELYKLFIYVDYQSFISHIICKYFLPFSMLLFVLSMVSFAMQKILSLIRFHLFIFAFRGSSKKILLRFMSKNILYRFSLRIILFMLKLKDHLFLLFILWICCVLLSHPSSKRHLVCFQLCTITSICY